ncbi:DUF6086 family protein [Streptomyces sp. NPDC002446]
MSCFFRIGDRDVWNPSNSVARVFIGQANVLSDVLGEESGIGPIIDDECEINGGNLREFAIALIRRYEESNNPALRVLMEGVAGICILLLRRARVPMDGDITELVAAWEEKFSEVSRGMPEG